MLEAAEKLEFERAALLRDQIKSLQNQGTNTEKKTKKIKY